MTILATDSSPGALIASVPDTTWSSACEAPVIIIGEKHLDQSGNHAWYSGNNRNARLHTGLQIYQNDSWQDVPAIPDTFIINLGGLRCWITVCWAFALAPLP
jgi:hypothetical protein